MRTLTLIGRLTMTTAFVARRCAWCGLFYRIKDRLYAALGAACSDGCCDSCVEKLLKEDA